MKNVKINGTHKAAETLECLAGSKHKSPTSNTSHSSSAKYGGTVSYAAATGNRVHPRPGQHLSDDSQTPCRSRRHAADDERMRVPERRVVPRPCIRGVTNVERALVGGPVPHTRRAGRR